MVPALRIDSLVPNRQGNREPAAAALDRRKGHVAAVGASDLPDDRKPETGSLQRRARGAPAIEGLEDPFAIGVGHAGAAVLDDESHRAARLCVDADARGAAAVTLRVRQEIADHPPQEPGISMNDDRPPFDTPIKGRGFLGGQRNDRSRVKLCKPEPVERLTDPMT